MIKYNVFTKKNNNEYHIFKLKFQVSIEEDVRYF
jgi:hypothetical protein